MDVTHGGMGFALPNATLLVTEGGEVLHPVMGSAVVGLCGTRWWSLGCSNRGQGIRWDDVDVRREHTIANIFGFCYGLLASWQGAIGGRDEIPSGRDLDYGLAAARQANPAVVYCAVSE